MKLLAFSASLRSESLNYKLVRKIAESIENKGDHTVMVVNLKDFELPFYDGDIEMENGLPENAKKFKEILNHMDGLVISCPEYNGGISAVMKNFIDWVSRKGEDTEAKLAFKDKIAFIACATTSQGGGKRGLNVLRMILGNVGVKVASSQFGLATADQCFDDEGQFTDKTAETNLDNAVGEFLNEFK